MKRYILGAWRYVLPFVLVSCLFYAGFNTQNLITQQIVDSLVQRRLDRLFLFIGLGILVSLVLYLVLAASALLRKKVLWKIRQALRRDIVESLAGLSPQEFGLKGCSAYLSYLNNDIAQLSNSSLDAFTDLVRILPTLVSALALLLYYNWVLALLAVLGSLPIIFGPQLSAKRMAQYSQAESSSQEQFTKMLRSLLEGYNLLRVFNRQKYFQRQGAESSALLETSIWQKEKFSALVELVLESLSMSYQLALFAYAGYLAIQGRSPVGLIMVVGNLSGALSNSIAELVQVRNRLIQGRPIIQKFLDLEAQASQRRTSQTQLPAGETASLSFQRSLCFENVAFAYEGKPVLQGLDLCFEKGKKYALLGPSGSGKTTALRLLLGFAPDYEGQILVDGQSLKEGSGTEIYRLLSYIDQECYIFDTTLRENLCLGADYSEAAIQKALDEAELMDYVASLPEGLDTPMGHKGDQMSGGQRQRLAIARALLHGRDLLLIDEGTSALDLSTARAIEERLLKDERLTVILISHHLTAESRRLLDGIYQFQNGRAQAQAV